MHTFYRIGVHSTPYLFYALTIFILSGCGSNIIKPLPVCPGKANVTESLAALQAQSENMIPLYTNNGKFSIQYYENDKMQKQHFQIRHLLIKPPSEIFLQAKTGIIDKAMVLGSNTQEFWLEVKPDPINSYWWGQWSDQDEDAGIMINPKTMLEALGIYEERETTGEGRNIHWSLANEGAYDILTKTEKGIISKKLYIYCCDYRVKKIEYYDKYGKPIVLAKLDKYTEVSPGFFIPFSVEIKSLSKNVEDTFNVEIGLDTIKPATQAQANYKIVLPKTPSIEHVYQIINGDWNEQ
jgi:hypothetical protein